MSRGRFMGRSVCGRWLAPCAGRSHGGLRADEALIGRMQSTGVGWPFVAIASRCSADYNGSESVLTWVRGSRCPTPTGPNIRTLSDSRAPAAGSRSSTALFHRVLRPLNHFTADDLINNIVDLEQVHVHDAV